MDGECELTDEDLEWLSLALALALALAVTLGGRWGMETLSAGPGMVVGSEGEGDLRRTAFHLDAAGLHRREEDEDRGGASGEGMKEKKAVSGCEMAERQRACVRLRSRNSHVPAAATETATPCHGRGPSGRGTWTTSAASYTDYPTRASEREYRANWRRDSTEWPRWKPLRCPLYLCIPSSLALDLFTWRPHPHPIRSGHIFVLSSSATAAFLSPLFNVDPPACSHHGMPPHILRC